MRAIMLAGLLGLGAAAAAAPPDIPPPLRDWKAWVLHGQERQTCPNIAPDGDARMPVCAWPGLLRIEADARGARFSQTWDMSVADRVPLPGGGTMQPEAVQVDGRPAPVLDPGAYGAPMLHLQAGRHTVSGRFVWSERPASLDAPPTALIELRVDGRRIDLPQRDPVSGGLLLGATEKHEADALDMQVARLLHDDLPTRLVTWLHLYVSGKPRELALGKVLPAGWTLVGVDGDLNARLAADGELIVQLQPGEHELLVRARAARAIDTFKIETMPAPWPAQEALQFAGVPRFRVARIDGLPALDPARADLPDDWSDLAPDMELDAPARLPTFLLTPGHEARIETRQRGLPAQRPAQLRLQRELWLDFDGAGYTARDHIEGDLGSLRRLDMDAPWTLQSARAGDRQLLITRTPEAERAGIELREVQVALQAQARAAHADLPGWTQGFDAAEFRLNLGPGWRLLGATGAERAIGSWWDAWSLLDLFLSSLAVVMAWRLGRWPAAAAMLAFVLLFWNHTGAPHLLWLYALALALLLRGLGDGVWQRRVQWLQRAVLLGVVLIGLPFAANELRLALHPQLEGGTADAMPIAARTRAVQAPAEAPIAFEDATPMAIEAPPAAPPPETFSTELAPQRTANEKATALDRVEVSGTRINPNERFELPADAIPQVGEAAPEWRWSLYRLTWAGPLRADDHLGLLLSPPWLTRLWHLAGLGLLIALLWQLRGSAGIRARSRTPGADAAALALLLASASMLLPAPARAQDALPSQALLDQLRQRLLEPDPRCVDDCLRLGVAQLQASSGELRLLIEVEATASAALSLPELDGGVLTGAALDARALGVASARGSLFALIDEGQHRLELRWRLGPERLSLRFGKRPARLQVQAPDYAVSGLEQERMSGTSLSLTPKAPAAVPVDAGAGTGAPIIAAQAPPFVHVERQFILDREWTLHTRVERIAPIEAGFGFDLPLLPGEQVLPADAEAAAPLLEAGTLHVNFPAGEDVISWSSRLPAAPSLELHAASRADLYETWRVTVSPLLHASADGVPLSLAADATLDPFGVWHFLPLPGEQLRIAVQRPPALAGQDQAIDRVALQGSHGDRASHWQLDFRLRATRAGELHLPLPAGAVLQGFNIDGRPMPLLLNDGAIDLPVRIGAQDIGLAWQLDGERGHVLRTPALELGRSAANLRYTLSLPSDRWLLFTHGPGIGPAVLLWGELLILAALAWLLGRWPGTPLRTWHWLLLGLGFAMVSWSAAVLVALWLLALGARARIALHGLSRRPAWLLQIGLGLLTLIALAALLMAVPAGLLGSPDMGVRGNGSNAHMLYWLLDRSPNGTVPSAAMWTLPLWAYKAAVLAWALWLASALLRWLRWGWQCAGVGGYRPMPPPPDAATPPPGDADAADDR